MFHFSSVRAARPPEVVFTIPAGITSAASAASSGTVAVMARRGLAPPSIFADVTDFPLRVICETVEESMVMLRSKVSTNVCSPAEISVSVVGVTLRKSGALALVSCSSLVSLPQAARRTRERKRKRNCFISANTIFLIGVINPVMSIQTPFLRNGRRIKTGTAVTKVGDAGVIFFVWRKRKW